MFLKNLNALNSQNPNLAKRLKEFSLEYAQKAVSVLQAESGDLVIAYKDKPLDDLINPLEKSKNIWNTLVKDQLKAHDIVLVFGLGLGYLFKRAYVSSNSRILVYEPNIEVLRFVFEYVDFFEQLQNKRVYIADKESDCVEYLSEKYISNDKIEIVYSDIYSNLFTDSLLSLSEKIIHSCESKRADVSTINKLSKLWTLNSTENVKHMAHSRPLNLLKNAFVGQKALILGAGPSLKNNINLIKQNRDKYIVFAVNKVLDYIVDNGICPDFLLTADAQWIEYTMRLMPDVFEKINLISTPKADSFVYKQNFHSIFNYYLKNDAFCEELNNRFPEEITLYDAEGTAISLGYYCALEMGFSTIIFCGLDLAIKQNEGYAQDLKMDVKDGIIRVGSNPKDAKKIVKIKSCSGNMVETRDDYALFASQLEAAFLKNSCAKLYNTTDFGAYIEGMTYEPLLNILKDTEPVSIDVNSKIKDLYSESEERWQEIYEVQLELLKKQQEDMLQIKSSVEFWIEKNKKTIESFDKDNVSRLMVEELQEMRADEISIIKHVLNNPILGSYFQAEIFEYSRMNDISSDFLDSRFYSLTLFEQIAKTADSIAADLN